MGFGGNMSKMMKQVQKMQADMARFRKSWAMSPSRGAPGVAPSRYWLPVTRRSDRSGSTSQ